MKQDKQAPVIEVLYAYRKFILGIQFSLFCINLLRVFVSNFPQQNAIPGYVLGNITRLCPLV